MISELGQFYLFKNGTIGRVVREKGFRIALRKVSSCKGKISSKDRIGKPYTYQISISAEQLNKAKRIGTEELLKLLFERYKKWKKMNK